MTNKTKKYISYYIRHVYLPTIKGMMTLKPCNVVQQLIMLLTWGLLTSKSELGMVGGGRQVIMNRPICSTFCWSMVNTAEKDILCFEEFCVPLIQCL